MTEGDDFGHFDGFQIWISKFFREDSVTFLGQIPVLDTCTILGTALVTCLDEYSVDTKKVE